MDPLSVVSPSPNNFAAVIFNKFDALTQLQKTYNIIRIGPRCDVSCATVLSKKVIVFCG